MSKKQELENGIYFKAMQDESTHFIAYKNGEILNPYDSYQFPNSHGFCQMFSFFMYMNNDKTFKKVHFTKSLFSANELEKYVYNSYNCLQKFIKLLNNPKYKNVRDAFERDFKNSTTTPKAHFGIQRGTTFDQFLLDLKKIPIEQVFVEMIENYDAYAKTITQPKKKKVFQQELKNFSAAKQLQLKGKDETNPKLCVLPTEGETQYEAFQAIIANSFRGGTNSVYSKLLKNDGIKLIQGDIYKLAKFKR